MKNKRLKQAGHCCLLLICLLLICLPLWSGATTPPQVREYQLKAVYLNGYTKFITWPQHVSAKADSPYTLCVLGENPFGTALEKTVAKTNRRKAGKGPPLQVRYPVAVTNAQNCHVLYISDSEVSRFIAIINALKPYPVLTVSDIDGFAAQGGMVEFYPRDSNVRFKLNLRAVRAAGLEPNANLLRIADIVEP